jgi:hypothetical protein
VSPDELSLACRLSGLTVDDLWLRFLEVGGNRSKAELRARLAGAPWPEHDDRVLALVAVEALREAGLPPLAPPTPVLTALVVRPVFERFLPSPASTAVARTRLLGNQLSTLFARCAGARAQARFVRERAVSVRRASAETSAASRAQHGQAIG